MSDSLANVPPQFQGLIWYLGLIVGLMGVMLVVRWAFARHARDRQAAREQARDKAIAQRLEAIETVQGDIQQRLQRLESRSQDRPPPQ